GRPHLAGAAGVEAGGQGESAGTAGVAARPGALTGVPVPDSPARGAGDLRLLLLPAVLHAADRPGAVGALGAPGDERALPALRLHLLLAGDRGGPRAETAAAPGAGGAAVRRDAVPRVLRHHADDDADRHRRALLPHHGLGRRPARGPEPRWRHRVGVRGSAAGAGAAGPADPVGPGRPAGGPPAGPQGRRGRRSGTGGLQRHAQEARRAGWRGALTSADPSPPGGCRYFAHSAPPRSSTACAEECGTQLRFMAWPSSFTP